MEDLLYKDEAYSIIGACMKVHSSLGSGFLESVYSEALTKEFEKRKIPFEREKKIDLFYDGSKMNKYFKACHPEERRIFYNDCLSKFKVY